MPASASWVGVEAANPGSTISKYGIIVMCVPYASAKGSGAPSYRHTKIRKCVTDRGWVRAFLENCNLCENSPLSLWHLSDCLSTCVSVRTDTLLHCVASVVVNENYANFVCHLNAYLCLYLCVCVCKGARREETAAGIIGRVETGNWTSSMQLHAAGP